MCRWMVVGMLMLTVEAWADASEPDLSGLWHRENGAVLDAKRGPDGVSWVFVLVKPAPNANPQAAQAVGREVITGLRWRGGKWVEGKIHGGAKAVEAGCELRYVDPKTVELRVSAFLISGSDTLRR